MASEIDYRGLVTITSPDPSGDGGLLCQNNFRSLADSILVVSGLISGGGISLTQLNTLSGYLNSRDSILSGYLSTFNLLTYDTILNATSVSGYFASQIVGGSVTQPQLSNLSGYLNSRDSTLSGYLTTYNSITYGTIINDTNISGYLQKRDTDISGYLVSLGTSSFDTVSNASNVSGYLQVRDTSISGYLSSTKESLSNKNVAGGYLGIDSSYRVVVSGIAEPFLMVSYSSGINLDMSAGSFFKTTQTGNITINNPINAIDGNILVYKLKQAGGTSGILTLGSKFLTGQFIVANSATSGKVDFLAARYDSADDKFYILGFAPGY